MLKKRFMACLLVLLVFTTLLAGCKKKETPQDPTIYLTGIHYVAIDVQNYGTITLALDADTAPITVTNFLSLAESGFYNGLTFHRIIDGFMVQGGDPSGDGTGGSEQKITGEFSANGIENPISHTRGTISMARSKDYNSASSQFFITQQDSGSLDGIYAAFGKVLAGMGVVDLLCMNTPVQDENGTVLEEDQPIINSIYTISEEAAQLAVEAETITPSPTAVLSFDLVDSIEDAAVVDEWLLADEGECFLLSCDQDLLSISVHTVDLANALDYDSTTQLATFSDLGAGELIGLRLVVPEGLPSMMIVTDEHNGAVGKYLISYDGLNGGAYLVPVIE